MAGKSASTAALIIPALNEAPVLGRTLASIPPGLFHTVIVADNGSDDGTPEIARSAGAQVTIEPERGYGAACMRALASLDRAVAAVVFMQADLSEDPAEASRLLEPIFAGRADLVSGSRTMGGAQPGSLLPHQAFGNQLVLLLLRLLYGRRFSDLGPFRAIRLESLRRMPMSERNYGWIVEMQVLAILYGLRIEEVPVTYRVRAAGENKVSGRIMPSIRAGFKMISTALRLRFVSVHSGSR